MSSVPYVRSIFAVIVFLPLRGLSLTPFRIDFIGERSMEAATAAHVSKLLVFLPLRGLSLTLSKTEPSFFPNPTVSLFVVGPY
jgi:hypothetical protein